ncbi:MAG: RecX family transcriptional regulator [Verrucomicrobia bacterium]|nr:RecX family transcriptional regulator [Verrucomicrobiota bacterium]
MDYQLQQSRVEKGIYEVLQNGEVIRELEIRFLLPKTPTFSTLEDLEVWVAESEEKLARKKIYQFLSARNYSSAELQSKLQKLGISAPICTRIIEEVKRLGYIQDGEYLENAIEKEFRKGYGPRYIEMKLQSKGLDSRSVRDLITRERQREKILELQNRKRDRAKLIRFLQQRGFDYDIIIENFS